MIQLSKNNYNIDNLKYKKREIIIQIPNSLENELYRINKCRVNLINYNVQKGSGYNSQLSDSSRSTIVYQGNIDYPFIRIKNKDILNINATVEFFDMSYNICTNDSNNYDEWHFSNTDIKDSMKFPLYRSSKKELYIPFPQYYNMDHQLFETDLKSDFFTFTTTINEFDLNYYNIPISRLFDENTKVKVIKGNVIKYFENDNIISGAIDIFNIEYSLYEKTFLFINNLNFYLNKLNIKILDMTLSPIGYELTNLKLAENSFENNENIKIFYKKLYDIFNNWYKDYNDSKHFFGELFVNSHKFIHYENSNTSMKILYNNKNNMNVNMDIVISKLYEFECFY